MTDPIFDESSYLTELPEDLKLKRAAAARRRRWRRRLAVAALVAVVGAVVTSRVGASVHADLSSASPPGWWTLTACGGVVLLLGFMATTSRAVQSARRTAVELNPEALAV